jgi:CheY-like chemotaxis protein
MAQHHRVVFAIVVRLLLVAPTKSISQLRQPHLYRTSAAGMTIVSPDTPDAIDNQAQGRTIPPVRSEHGVLFGWGCCWERKGEEMAVPVLVVDDSAPIREMIVSILAPRGYTVCTARDGTDALDKLRGMVERHIILLDVMMPGVDGPTVAHEIDRDESLRALGHIVVLMSSALRLAARDIPATAVQLAKPFTRQQLLEMLEHLNQLAV